MNKREIQALVAKHLVDILTESVTDWLGNRDCYPPSLSDEDFAKVGKVITAEIDRYRKLAGLPDTQEEARQKLLLKRRYGTETPTSIADWWKERPAPQKEIGPKEEPINVGPWAEYLNSLDSPLNSLPSE